MSNKNLISNEELMHLEDWLSNEWYEYKLENIDRENKWYIDDIMREFFIDRLDHHGYSDENIVYVMEHLGYRDVVL